jgi:hypothetical protein
MLLGCWDVRTSRDVQVQVHVPICVCGRERSHVCVWRVDSCVCPGGMGVDTCTQCNLPTAVYVCMCVYMYIYIVCVCVCARARTRAYICIAYLHCLLRVGTCEVTYL